METVSSCLNKFIYFTPKVVRHRLCTSCQAYLHDDVLHSAIRRLRSWVVVNRMRLITLGLLACWLCSVTADFHEAEIVPASRRAQFHGVRCWRFV